MCQTFYKEHERCSCIYILTKYIPCREYTHPEKDPEMLQDPFADPQESPSSSDPEESPSLSDPDESSTISDPFADAEEDPFAVPIPAEPISKTKTPLQATRPKLLTHKHEGLDLTHNGIDFISNDVDDSIAPKGVLCPRAIIATSVPRAEGEDGKCALCDVPDALAIAEINAVKRRERGLREADMQTQGVKGKGKAKDEKAEDAKEKGKEKGKSVFHKTARAVKSLKSAATGSKGKKPEITSLGYDMIRERVEEGEGSKRAEEKKSKKEKKEKKKRERPVIISMMDPSVPIGYRPMILP